MTCVFNESCILPCELHVGSDPLIHWIHMSTREHFVLSFYNNQTQLGHQVQRFRGRTSLFTDQIPRRNASLLLTAVKIQDEGRYVCRTSTSEGNKKAFVDLKIEGKFILHYSKVVSTVASQWEGHGFKSQWSLSGRSLQVLPVHAWVRTG